MKILHLSGKDFYGAGRATFRLHKALQSSGVDSTMWVGQKQSDDDSVINIQKGNWLNFIRKVNVKLEKLWIGKFTGTIFSSGRHAMSLAKKINRFKADIIHIHWINRGFISINDITSFNGPIIFTMHDMWYFTGGCHVTGNCSKFISHCCSCSQLVLTKHNDVAKQVFMLKEHVYNNSNPLFIAPSNWMYNMAKSSALLQKKRIDHVPNTIDVELFKKRTKIRKPLEISDSKKLVLFGAIDATSDANKGFAFLDCAIRQLDKSKYELIVVGGKSTDVYDNNLPKVHNVGYVADEYQMVEYLSVADVVVVPSKQENFSNMILEAMACSTPVVAFDIGGNSDLIRHKQNGYLAEAFDSKDLANGIDWVSSDSERNLELSNNAREYVVNNFNMRIIAEKHIALYKILIGKMH